MDSAGNVFVADRENDAIRKVTSAGVVTTLAGGGEFGSADGTGSAAQFGGPSGVAVDSAGNVFVADTFNHTIRKVTSAGVVTTLAGSAGAWGINDGMGSAARFFHPYGVAVDSSGNVLVADTGNWAIRKVTSAGVVTTLAGSAALLTFPQGLAVDSAGNVFVACSGGGGNTILKVTSAGVVTTLAGRAAQSGTNDGTGSAARFNNPGGVAVDSAGNVFVADTDNDTIREVTSAGMVTTIGGLAGVSGGVDGIGSSAIFASPSGIALDSAGTLYVADPDNNRVIKGTLSVGNTNAAVTLTDLSQTYDGTAKPIAYTTVPPGLTVNVTYDGSPNPPTNVGSYAVSGTVNDLNYQGSATNTLVIQKATASVTLSNLVQTYDGMAKSVTATTTPPALGVSLTYNAYANAPINAGIYTVVGTINDANYQGGATNPLVILKATASVTLSNLTQTYDGTAKPVSVTTSPTNLGVTVTYNGSLNAPTNAGTYTVIATANDLNYQGNATNNLIIKQPVASGDVIFRQVAAGWDHTVAVKTDGTLWAWGNNYDGELGDGTTVNKSNPVQIGTATNWQSVAAGGSHTVAVKTDGTLWAWGYNSDGQLGDGTTGSKSSPVQIGTATNWQSVATGKNHTVAVKADGTLWAWGYNYFGQLGDGTTGNKSSPVQIGTATNWQTVAASGVHTVAVKRDGTLWAWGYNSDGQLGDGTTGNKSSSVQIGTATNWQAVAASDDHTVAVKTDGTLWTWGYNGFGELGDGTTGNKSGPVQIGAATNWQAVAAGDYYTVAVKTDGTLWAWGDNASGQLGDGTTGNKSSPVQMGTATNWQSVAAGYSHTVAVKTDGTLWAWGNNYYGQLGDGTTGGNKSSPVRM